ncbi:hypothetical protein JCM10908_006200 [Rhodotorula pacifica]|uniref:uncharacterized protein n=1 Tax=Rhodotorula pacifica TaxID=1495444 RepID=UPI003179C9ED
MSSANVHVALPKHSRDDHPLVYPGIAVEGDADSAASADAKGGKNGSNAASASAALSRALAGMLAFMFKKPIRLFRPVKISTMAGIQAIAEEQGRTVTPAFVRGLIRKEGWRFFPKHVLPPLAINALIGLTLFTTYTTSESLLHARFTSPAATFLLIPFASGAFAGAAQSIISAPLDNARHLLLRRQRFLRQAAEVPRASRRQRLRQAIGGSAGLPFTSWSALLRDSVFKVGSTAPAALSAELSPATTAKLSGRERLERARRWARRGWSFFTLSVTKDSIAFGVFFVIFESGREGARRFGLAYDGITIPDLSTYDEREGVASVPDKQRRSASGLVLQSLGILISGGVAGWVFSLVARPFERVRAAIYEGRARWAEQQTRAEDGKRGGSARADTAQSGTRARDQRARSAGGASERRSLAKLGDSGRKSFMVRIGHLRTVTRRPRPSASREGHPLAPTDSSTAPKPAHKSSPGNFPGSPLPARHEPQQVTTTRTPMPSSPATLPSAVALVRQACRQYGTARFLFGPRAALQALDAQRQRASFLPSATGKPSSPPPKRPSPGPTRLSARGRQAAVSVQTSAGSRLLRAGSTVIRYVPPYAIGFFAYAIVSGDLKIEV